MTIYSCTLCGEQLADSSMNSAELNNMVCEHVYRVHRDTDPRQVLNCIKSED
jgi:hypothetical protein